MLVQNKPLTFKDLRVVERHGQRVLQVREVVAYLGSDATDPPLFRETWHDVPVVLEVLEP